MPNTFARSPATRYTEYVRYEKSCGGKTGVGGGKGGGLGGGGGGESCSPGSLFATNAVDFFSLETCATELQSI